MIAPTDAVAWTTDCFQDGRGYERLARYRESLHADSFTRRNSTINSSRSLDIWPRMYDAFLLIPIVPLFQVEVGKITLEWSSKNDLWKFNSMLKAEFCRIDDDLFCESDVFGIII